MDREAERRREELQELASFAGIAMKFQEAFGVSRGLRVGFWKRVSRNGSEAPSAGC